VLTTKYNEFSGSDDRKAPDNHVQLDYRPAASMVPMAMIESNTETHPATVARRFPGFFEDKIVIIGANTPVDQHRTPLPGQYNILSGVTVQGIAVDNLLSGEALRRSPLLVSILITGIVAGLAYFLAKRTPAVFWVLSF